FTKALDDAVLAGQVDLAVHSAKDMPADLPEGLAIWAYLRREDPRDVLLGCSPEIHLENFSRPLVIGTSSVRRRALLGHYFSHVEVRDLRGNIDTRLRKLEEGQYDAIMLAYAGVKRMGWDRYIVQKLNPHIFTPAIGQGAIAIVGQADHPQRERVAALLDHMPTAYAVNCERRFLHILAGGCITPAFGLATVTPKEITLTAGLVSEDTQDLWRFTESRPLSEGLALGEALARNVLKATQSNGNLHERNKTS
ncbi:MAG: hydroxymethylbilane synthase, partial [Bacteroidota bacterium]